MRTWTDQSIMVLALLGLSVPEFWLGLMLIFAFAVRLHWFPAGGFVPLTQSFVGLVAQHGDAGIHARGRTDGLHRAHDALGDAGGAAARISSAPPIPRDCHGAWW